MGDATPCPPVCYSVAHPIRLYHSLFDDPDAVRPRPLPSRGLVPLGAATMAGLGVVVARVGCPCRSPRTTSASWVGPGPWWPFNRSGTGVTVSGGSNRWPHWRQVRPSADRNIWPTQRGHGFMPRSRASDSKESPYRSRTGMSNDYPSLWFPNMPNPAERHALFALARRLP